MLQKNYDTGKNKKTKIKQLRNNEKQKLIKYYKRELNKVKTINSKLNLLKNKSSNNINTQIEISKVTNKLNSERKKIKSNLNKI